MLLALTDMQGRLQGKRLTARHFLDEVADHGAEGCNYLLAVDVEMNPVEGYAMASWERGYGDFAMRPDLDTLRLGPVAAGHRAVPGRPRLGRRLARSSPSPRQVLRRQLARLAERGWSDQRQHRARVPRLPGHLRGGLAQGLPRPRAGQPLQHRLLAAGHGPGRAADPPHPQRDGGAPGCAVENSKGECNLGQHEINFRYADALRCADEHAIYKNAAKEIAAQEGMSISFMAKFNEREGSSCHIHFSLADERGRRCSPASAAIFESFLAGQLACLRELTLLLAPNVNSYKRYAAGVVRPHRGGLGARQPHLRAARRRRGGRRCASRTGPAALTSTPTSP